MGSPSTMKRSVAGPASSSSGKSVSWSVTTSSSKRYGAPMRSSPRIRMTSSLCSKASSSVPSWSWTVSSTKAMERGVAAGRQPVWPGAPRTSLVLRVGLETFHRRVPEYSLAAPYASHVAETWSVDGVHIVFDPAEASTA